MVSKPRVLFDLDVILDVLQQRQPFFAASAHALAAAETGRLEGWVAAHSLTTLFYLLAKHHSAERARVAVGELLSFLTVAAVDQAVIERALTLPYSDWEDAVQMAAAAEVGAQYLITRNVEDYAGGPLPVLRPAELLTLL